MKLIAALLLVSMGSFAAAQTAAGYGAAMRCGEWTKFRADNAEPTVLMATSWIQGHLSGVNVGWSGSNPARMFAIPSATTIAAWMDKRCAEKPLDSLSQASLALAVELAFERARSPEAAR